MRVSILVFDQVEALDFAGPYEVFTTASRVWRRQHPDGPQPFEVRCVSPDGLPVTTHWEDLDDLRQRHRGLNVVDGPRWIDNGRVLTSAGIAAGLDMSLHLVGRLAGADLARRTARQMDYPWNHEDHARSALAAT